MGRLATVTQAGAPHVVPVTYVLAGDVVYTAVDAKPKRSRRLKRLANIEGAGVASLLVDHYEEDWRALWWCRLDGPARVVHDGEELERALEALIGKYHQYASDPPKGPAIVLDVQDWSGWSST